MKHVAIRVSRCVAMLLAGVTLAMAMPIIADDTARTRAFPHPAAQPIVVGGVANELMPIEGVVNGEPTGYSGDLLKALLGNAGVPLVARTYSNRADLLQAACNGDVDIIMSAVPRTDFERCVVYSAPYLVRSIVLVARNGDERALQDPFLATARVVVERGSPWAQEWRDTHPHGHVIETTTIADALAMVAAGHADLYAGVPYTLMRLRDRPDLAGLNAVRSVTPRSEGFHFGAPATRRALISEIDQRLAMLSLDTIEALRARWFYTEGVKSNVAADGIPESTLRAIQRKGVLRYAIPASAPPFLVLKDNAEPDGITVEYLNLLGKALGISTEYVPTRDIADALSKAEAGQIDLVAGLPASYPVPTHVLPLGVFESPPMVIVTAVKAPYVGSLDALAGKSIAISPRDPMTDLLRDRLPDSVQVPTASTLETLSAVDQGSADATVGNLTTMDTMIRERFAGELKIAGHAGLHEDMTIFAGPHLAAYVPSLRYAIQSIPEAQRRRIRDQWLTATYQFDTPWRLILKRSLPLLLLGAVAALIVGFSYFRLRREIRLRARTELALKQQLGFKEEARAQAQMLERRLRDVTDSLPAIVFQLLHRRGQGREGLDVTYAAGNSEASLGVTPQEIVAHPELLSRYVDADDIGAVHAAFQGSIVTGDSVEVECRLHGRHGLRWVTIRAICRQDETLTVWSGVIADVTENHEQADALRQASNAAEAALRAKEGFLAMMSHEIRTPLNGILGLVEILHATPLAADQRQMLTLVRESGHSLAQILDDVLDYAKMEAGHLRIVPIPVDVRALVDSVTGLLAPQAHGKRLALDVSTDEHVPEVVEADPIRLRQILLNLLGNAIKFTEHGSVSIDIALAHRTGRTVDLTFRVRDTGIGIAPEDLSRLFAPFVQSQHHGSRRFGGTGLGLSICRKLVTLMDGTLTLESEVGVGTTAVLDIRLPIAEAHAPGAVRAVPPADAWFGALRGMRALVVEDHAISRELMRQQLALLECECILCENGQKALETLEALQAQPFDLVLTDCHMPEMDGFALTRAIRAAEDPVVQSLPIVGVTATTLPEEHQRCLAAGMNAVVLKPTTLASIGQALTAHGGGGRHVDAPRSDGPYAPSAAPYLQWSETMRAVCRTAIADDRQMLLDLLDPPSVPALRDWCHRAGGGLSVLDDAALDQSILALSDALKSGDAVRIAHAAASIATQLDGHLLALDVRDALAWSATRQC